MEDVCSRARRGEQGRAAVGESALPRKCVMPCRQGCGRIVYESSPMGALVIVESSTGERGEPLLWRGRHTGSTAIRKRLGREPRQTGGGNRGNLGMMVLPSRRRRVRCAFEIHASPSAGVRLPAERGRGNASELCRIRLLSMFRTGAECREMRRTRHRNALLSASRVVFYPKIS